MQYYISSYLAFVFVKGESVILKERPKEIMNDKMNNLLKKEFIMINFVDTKLINSFGIGLKIIQFHSTIKKIIHRL